MAVFTLFPVLLASTGTITGRGMLKCLTLIVDLSVFPSSSISFPFLYCEALLFCPYTLRIDITC